jgi:hypothetical protein
MTADAMCRLAGPLAAGAEMERGHLELPRRHILADGLPPWLYSIGAAFPVNAKGN